MKVVALVSGGKDSCYAMLECVRFGHEIVCLAHLHPPSERAPEDAEIDSFMYQSVGHNVVKLIAESMEVPLVEGTITGTAIATGMDYAAPKKGDEVEDLHALLSDVLCRYPEVQGVCSGAIFSSYQRNRVENVCERLNLVSLGYLWRREQAALLHEMVAAGVHAILVKVAAIGLQPRKHLGRSLAELEPELLELKNKYKLNVCGEGGEYETLTLDCPLFKKRIVIDSSRTIMHSDDFCAPVAFLVIDQCHLEDKQEKDITSFRLDLPPVFNPPKTDGLALNAVIPRPIALDMDQKPAPMPRIHGFRQQFCLSGVMSIGDDSRSLEDEVGAVLNQASATLGAHGMTLEDVCFVHLYIRDMNDFAAINAEYCQYFGQYMPPSRSCVESNLLPCRVLMDCVAIRGSNAAKRETPRTIRDVLHVKSMSTWAPNCIGPYSQANILHHALLLLAGQIPLDPATMEITANDHLKQTQQCLCNVGRVLEALDANLRHVCSTIVYVVAANDLDAIQKVADSCRTGLIDNAGLDDEYEDVEDSDESDEDVDKAETRVALARHSPILAVQLSHLPRNALVEVEVQAVTHAVLKHPRLSSSHSDISLDAWRFDVNWSMIPRAMSLVACTAVHTSPDAGLSDSLPSACMGIIQSAEVALCEADLPWDRVLHLRVFYLPQVFAVEKEIATNLKQALKERSKGQLHKLPALTFVPVEAIQDGAQLAIQITAHDLDKMETQLWLQKQI